MTSNLGARHSFGWFSEFSLFVLLHAFCFSSRISLVAGFSPVVADSIDLDSLSREALIEHVRLLESFLGGPEAVAVRMQSSARATQTLSSNGRALMRTEPKLGPTQTVEVDGKGQLDARQVSQDEADRVRVPDFVPESFVETSEVSHATRMLASILPMEDLSNADRHDFVHSLERDPAFAQTVTNALRKLARHAVLEVDRDQPMDMSGTDEAETPASALQSFGASPTDQTDSNAEEPREPEIAIADLGPEEDNSNGADWATSGLDAAHAAKLKTEESVLRMIKLASVLRHKEQGDAQEELKLENELIDGKKGPSIMTEIVDVADSAKEPVDDLVKLGVALRAQDLVRLEKYELGAGKDLEQDRDGDIHTPEAVQRLEGPPRERHVATHAANRAEVDGTAGTPEYSPAKLDAAGAAVKETKLLSQDTSQVLNPSAGNDVPVAQSLSDADEATPQVASALSLNASSLLSQGTREELQQSGGIPHAWPKDDDGRYAVKYCRGPGLGNRAWKKFREAADQLHEHCELLQFVEVGDSNTCELRVRGDKEGCWSYVGYVGTEGQLNEINLKEGSWWSENFQGTCAVRGIVEHELLHTLGLRHEQSREDRDEYVTTYPKNVMTFKNDAFELSERPKQQEFGTSSDESTVQKYDVGSVMHVGCKAFSKSIFADTIRANRRRRFYDGYGGREDCAKMGQRQGLVMTDVQQIRQMYGNCEARRRRAPGANAAVPPKTRRRRWW